jgi:signal transduction histidine kinase
VLGRKRQSILQEFEARLRASSSPLLSDGQANGLLKEQCLAILEEVASVLRGGHFPEPSRDNLSQNIGILRADRHVHPGDSLRAAVELSEAALFAVTEALGSDVSPNEVAEIFSLIQRSIIERVARASVAYGDYLLARLQESHDDERRRVSRELHDRVAHSIMVAFRNLELLELYEGRDPIRAREKLGLAKEAAQQALKSTRDLSSELRTSFAEQGLEVALSEYLRLLAPPNVRAWVSAKGDESLVPNRVRDELFLILREAVRNAATHSGARFVRVELYTSKTEFRGVVEDDGRGLKREPGADKTHSGTGLASMEERASLLRGTLRLGKRPGGGTKVEIVVPLPRINT